MITSDIIVGFVSGVIITLILGWFWELYKRWLRDTDAYDNPQKIEIYTNKSPSQVAREASRAKRRIFLTNLAIIVLILFIIELFLPGTFENIIIFLIRLVSAIVNG